MKRFCLLLMFVSAYGYSQENAFCDKIQRIAKIIRKEHFRPKPIDDSLSVFVFDAFVDGLDPHRNILTKTEYDRLAEYRLTLDNNLSNDNCGFITVFTSVYKLALERKLRLLSKLQDLPINYAMIDTLRFSKEGFPFEMRENDQERILTKRAKVEILDEISRMSTNLDSLKTNFSSIEETVKPKIFEIAKCKITSLIEDKAGLKSKLEVDFLNIFCSYFDPHSNYFTLDAKSSFMSMLSTSNLSLGLNFTLNEKEELIIEEVIPGGPAARSGKLEKNDVMIKVADKNNFGYTVSCASLDAIGEMIYSDSNNELKITVRKKNGSIQEVNLVKELMNASENTITSFIAEKDIRVGYIKIPNFYSDFESNNLKGCADDTAKEIIKLQRDQIHGLVIDLQDNGGGSMDEAERLAGMFISYGPVSILADSNGRETVLNDINPGTFYTGPLVILINGQSASASEFFASTMQDYKRGFVLGARSSGKATMQSILPLDYKNRTDFVKLTLQKFYRITGESCQSVGVMPDVSMPVLFDSIVPREKNLKNALKNDRLSRSLKFSEYNSANNDDLRAISRERIKRNSQLKEIQLLNSEINKWYGKMKNPILLSLDEFFKDAHQNDSLWKKIKAVAERPTETIIRNSTFEEERMKLDAFYKEINAYQLKDLQGNPYLDEAVNLISDYYKLRN